MALVRLPTKLNLKNKRFYIAMADAKDTCPIPSISYDVLLNGDSNSKLQAACEVHNALKTYGVCRVKSHGIPQDIIDACFEKVCSITAIFLLDLPGSSQLIFYNRAEYTLRDLKKRRSLTTKIPAPRRIADMFLLLQRKFAVKHTSMKPWSSTMKYIRSVVTGRCLPKSF